MKTYKIFAINPGSTSTKVALFEDAKECFNKNVTHEAAKLKEFKEISDQLIFRRDVVLGEVAAAGYTLDSVDAFASCGGGLLACEGGVYNIGDVLLNHAVTGANGVQHPANLGAQLAKEFARKYGKPAFVVNPPDVDEFHDLARITGIKDVYRTSHLHALNLKETAIRHAASQGKKYEDCNFIVCHIGGGISVSAHRKGKMIDGDDVVGGDGPMTPTRCGSVPVAAIASLFESGMTAGEIRQLCMKTGGFVSHFGTSDAREVNRMAAEGNKAATRVWNAMIYQIIKYIGSMAAALGGDIDGVLLGGGLVNSKDLVGQITGGCGWIAPVTAYPGEFEMAALAAGAIRVLKGEERAKEYSGIPVWNGFED